MIIGNILGILRDNGKENVNYYNESYMLPVWMVLGFWGWGFEVLGF